MSHHSKTTVWLYTTKTAERSYNIQYGRKLIKLQLEGPPPQSGPFGGALVFKLLTSRRSGAAKQFLSIKTR